MGSVDVLREITPLSPEDCFLVMQRPKRSFSYPLHVHPEFELNYLENAAGAIRIVGDSVEEMILRIQPELKKLSSDKPDSFHNLLRLIEILKTLSLDEKARKLNAINTVENFSNIDNDRLDTIMLFLHENYQRPVLLSELASLINMSEASLTRFLKKWTGKTFIDNLNDIRIAEAVCRLIDTSDTIAEICYKSGFNNLSNFNRAFKRRKGNTPTEYREKYARTRFRI